MRGLQVESDLECDRFIPTQPGRSQVWELAVDAEFARVAAVEEIAGLALRAVPQNLAVSA